MAKMKKKKFIGKEDVVAAIKESRPIEEKVKEKYGNWWAIEGADHGAESSRAGPETA